MLDLKTVMGLIGRWGGTLKFFPSDPDARIGIAEELAVMARDEEQIRWLVGRLPKLFEAWPAMHEVRAVFCSKFQPRDGIEVYSTAYVDGIPAERESLKQIEVPALRRLTASELTPDPEMAALVSMATKARALPRCMPTIVDPEDNELRALMRDIDADKKRQSKQPLPTQAEIDYIKLQQEKNRQFSGIHEVKK